MAGQMFVVALSACIVQLFISRSRSRHGKITISPIESYIDIGLIAVLCVAIVAMWTSATGSRVFLGILLLAIQLVKLGGAIARKGRQANYKSDLATISATGSFLTPILAALLIFV